MRLSLRTKILAAYGVLFALFILILWTGFSQFRGIATRLDLIQLGYLPITKTVNSFQNVYHMDESFDVGKIVENRRNRLFLDSVSIANPRLLEQGFRKDLSDARQALRRSPAPKQERALDRVGILVNALLEKHRAYHETIRATLADVGAGRLEQARKRNPTLLERKREVRAQLDLLSRKLDQLVRDGIQDTVREERRAVFGIVGLSVLTLVAAVLIGILATRSLRPLGRLKQAAREIAAGDLRKRVEIATHDEVGELASEFNRMADSIEERDAAIRSQQERLLASEKMAVIGRMASKISHEVKNPLNALGLNVELLEEEIDGEGARERLRTMSREIDRLNQVVGNYLNLARSPRGTEEKVDVTRIVAHLETLIRPECERRGIAVEIDAPSGLPELRLDVTRIEQALLNLARNAMEALAPGGCFGVRTRRENGALLLEVWDDGPGIPETALPHIFEPFYTTKEKGTGLGLAITHEIVREQGGTIECRSRPGEGSSFVIRLPLRSHDV